MDAGAGRHEDVDGLGHAEHRRVRQGGGAGHTARVGRGSGLQIGASRESL